MPGEAEVIEPYTAVGLIPSFWGIRRREDIEKNLEHLESLTYAAYWLSNLDIPVRLIAIPEGALQGFNDEVLDLDHTEFAQTCAIDIPGPETDRIGRLARKWGVFIMAQAKARHEDWPDVDTAIGRLGIMMAMEGSYPENARGLALNGAEVVYRASLPAPFTENDFFEITNR